MKLKSVSYYGRLKSVISTIKASATVIAVSRAVAAVSVGNFVNFVQKFNTASIQDAHTIDVSKIAANAAGATDQAVLLAGKALTHTTAVVEDEVLVFNKALSDTPAVTETHIFGFSRPLQNASLVSEAHAVAHSKFFTNVVNVTDDIDGAASILDDQELAVFKQRTNIANASDFFVRQVAFVRTFGNSSSTADAGLLLKQGYTTDPFYFAEDYVGSSHSFS